MKFEGVEEAPQIQNIIVAESSPNWQSLEEADIVEVIRIICSDKDSVKEVVDKIVSFLDK